MLNADKTIAAKDPSANNAELIASFFENTLNRDVSQCWRILKLQQQLGPAPPKSNKDA